MKDFREVMESKYNSHSCGYTYEDMEIIWNAAIEEAIKVSMNANRLPIDAIVGRLEDLKTD